MITYDRRGNSRNQLHEDNAELVMAAQSADPLAVLYASGFTSARIFGNRGGTAIALDLAAHHPQVAEAVVAHEPPVLAVLPDAAAYRTIYDDIEKVLHEWGWRRPASTLFQTRLDGASPDTVTALLDRATAFQPGQLLDLMTRVSGNWARRPVGRRGVRPRPVLVSRPNTWETRPEGRGTVSATLRVSRETSGIELRRGVFEILVDGKGAGPIKYGETIETPLEPGHHTLRIRAGRYSSRDHSFHLADNDAIDFRCSGAIFWPRWVLSLFKPDLGVLLKRG